MSPADRGVIEMAAEWHARLDAPEMDWDAFGLWLDADPAHRAAYDDVALLDAEIGEHRAAIRERLPANDEGEPVVPRKPRARWWAGGGIAAAGIAALLAPQLMTSPAMVAYSTGPTATRSITLGDGSRITLDRNSSLKVRDGSAPAIEMASGSAYFDIRHDPSRALVVTAGGYEVRDIGTRFGIDRRPGGLAVAVSEGKVMVAPADGEGTTVTAGERIDIVEADGAASIQPVSAGDVARWRQGQLVYDNSPLALVAADVGRYAGHAIAVDPAIADMRMSAVLTIGDGSRLVEQIEALLPVRAVAQGGSLRLVRSPH